MLRSNRRNLQFISLPPRNVDIEHIHSNGMLLTNEEIEHVKKVISQDKQKAAKFKRGAVYSKEELFPKDKEGKYDIVVGTIKDGETKICAVYKTLGKGSFGEVSQIQDLETGEWYAFKRMAKESKGIYLDEKQKEEKDKTEVNESEDDNISGSMVFNEGVENDESLFVNQMQRPVVGESKILNILGKYRGKIKEYDSVTNKKVDTIMLMMKLEKGVNLHDYLESKYEKKDLSPTVATQMILNLLAKAKELKEERIIHRDIKPLNIMFNPDRLEFEFIDVGTSVHIPGDEDIKLLYGTKEVTGTPEYADYAIAKRLMEEENKLSTKEDYTPQPISPEQMYMTEPEYKPITESESEHNQEGPNKKSEEEQLKQFKLMEKGKRDDLVYDATTDMFSISKMIGQIIGAVDDEAYRKKAGAFVERLLSENPDERPSDREVSRFFKQLKREYPPLDKTKVGVVDIDDLIKLNKAELKTLANLLKEKCSEVIFIADPTISLTQILKFKKAFEDNGLTVQDNSVLKNTKNEIILEQLKIKFPNEDFHQVKSIEIKQAKVLAQKEIEIERRDFKETGRVKTLKEKFDPSKKEYKTKAISSEQMYMTPADIEPEKISESNYMKKEKGKEKEKEKEKEKIKHHDQDEEISQIEVKKSTRKGGLRVSSAIRQIEEPTKTDEPKNSQILHERNLLQSSQIVKTRLTQFSVFNHEKEKDNKVSPTVSPPREPNRSKKGK